MARKKTNDSDGTAILVAIAGVILFIPFLIFTAVSYSKLKKEHLTGNDEQRIVDIRKPLPLLIGSGVALLISVFITMGTYSNGGGYIAIAIIVPLIMIVGGIIMARHLAVLYLNVVIDKESNLLTFPHDMQSYGVMDYFSLEFLRDLVRPDQIHLSEITKITRGDRGKDLYVHGSFGSRGISMTNKQKRDECINLIQQACSNRRLLTAEFESY